LGYLDKLAPAADVEFLIDIVQVALDRALAYPQSVCDLFVLEILRHQADYLVRKYCSLFNLEPLQDPYAERPHMEQYAASPPEWSKHITV